MRKCIVCTKPLESGTVPKCDGCIVGDLYYCNALMCFNFIISGRYCPVHTPANLPKCRLCNKKSTINLKYCHLHTKHIQQYNLTEQQYIDIYSIPKCQICKKKFTTNKPRTIDNNKKCCTGCINCIKGVLCVNCQQGLLRFGYDRRRIISVLRYLFKTRR